MKQYQKIQTVYYRDAATKNRYLLEGQFSIPEFDLLKNIEWLCTEKIDGTNIRITWDGEQVRFLGKSDTSTIPKHLLDYLEETFTNEKMKTLFSNTKNMCLYGEGFGKKIQNGHHYIADACKFILFDVKIGDWWLERHTCDGMAQILGIDIVPIIGTFKLEEAIELVKKGFKSTISENKEYIAEGLIMKPVLELFDRGGNRIITKIKYKDFDRNKSKNL